MSFMRFAFHILYIVVSQVWHKVYCQMILDWMRDVEAGELCKEQAGFRPKHSCEEHMFTLLSNIENCQYFQVLFASSISVRLLTASTHPCGEYSALMAVRAIKPVFDNSHCC